MLNAILLGFRLIILVLGGQKQIALENTAMRQQLPIPNAIELETPAVEVTVENPEKG